MLGGDRGHIWVNPEYPVEVDFITHQRSLQTALRMEPGSPRDGALCEALADEGVLLEDEPYADWVLRPREDLELLRQRARLELARDRSRGYGTSSPDAVIEGWEGCLAHDPSSEEAAAALMRIYAAEGRRRLVQSTFERCRDALEALGLRFSPALEEAYWTAAGAVGAAVPTPRRAGRTGASPAAARAPQRGAQVGDRSVCGAVDPCGYRAPPGPGGVAPSGR